MGAKVVGLGVGRDAAFDVYRICLTSPRQVMREGETDRAWARGRHGFRWFVGRVGSKYPASAILARQFLGISRDSLPTRISNCKDNLWLSRFRLWLQKRQDILSLSTPTCMNGFSFLLQCLRQVGRLAKHWSAKKTRHVSKSCNVTVGA